MKQRLPEIADGASIVAIAGGLGSRFGWWLAAVTAGVLVIAANWSRTT